MSVVLHGNRSLEEIRRDATRAPVLVEEHVKFMEKGLANAEIVIKENVVIFEITDGVSSPSSSDRGMEECRIGIPIPKPLDTRALASHCCLLPIEVGDLTTVVGLRLNQSRAHGVDPEDHPDTVEIGSHDPWEGRLSEEKVFPQ